MKTILVTGANGFIGKNLLEGLNRFKDIEVLSFDQGDTFDTLEAYLKKADFIYHLAGVNRPETEEEFKKVNVGLTDTIIALLKELGKCTPILITSSIQAAVDNPYGLSKKEAEESLIRYSQECQVPVYIYRLPNVFGKWSRPNYNSAIVTFCYNISHGLDVWVSDRTKEMEIVYIDDVVREFIHLLERRPCEDIKNHYYQIPRTFHTILGEIVDTIHSFKEIRRTSIVPDFADELTRCLYATYLSYTDKEDFSYSLDMKVDQRGWLAELIKSKHFGQIFVSKSHKGVLRGNHYHNSKIEKFCVIQGEAIIRFRNIFDDEVISYTVSGEQIQVVDIPPGYTHSIENVTDGEMIVLFWANEIFDPENPDTYFCEVK